MQSGWRTCWGDDALSRLGKTNEARPPVSQSYIVGIRAFAANCVDTDGFTVATRLMELAALAASSFLDTTALRSLCSGQ